MFSVRCCWGSVLIGLSYEFAGVSLLSPFFFFFVLDQNFSASLLQVNNDRDRVCHNSAPHEGSEFHALFQLDREKGGGGGEIVTNRRAVLGY